MFFLVVELNNQFAPFFVKSRWPSTYLPSYSGGSQSCLSSLSDMACRLYLGFRRHIGSEEFTMPIQGMAYEGIGSILPPNSVLYGMSYMGMPYEDTILLYSVN